VVYYTCPKGEGKAPREKKISKKSEKTLDKPLDLWYNKDKIRVATNADSDRPSQKGSTL